MENEGWRDWLVQHWEAATALVAIVGVITARTSAVAAAVRKAWAWCRMFFGAANRVIETLEKQNVQLASIEKELKPNGGGSMRDLLAETHRLAFIAEQRSQLAFADVSTAMYECAVDGNCTWVNAALCSIFGMDASAMYGRGWLTAIRSDQQTDCWEHYQKAITLDVPYSYSYVVVNQKTGDALPCYTTMTVLRDRKGHPLVYRGSVKITGTKV